MSISSICVKKPVTVQEIANGISSIGSNTCRESEAIEVIEHLESSEKLNSWLSQVENRQLIGVSMTVMEYTAIVYRLQQLQGQKLVPPDLPARLESCRTKGFIELVGRHPTKDNESWRLSKKVLRKAGREEVLFHQALFHSGVHSIVGSMRIILTDYIAKPRDIFYLLTLLAALSIPTVFTVLVGVLTGHIFASITEFFIHRDVAHATGKKKRKFSTLGKIGHYMTLLYTEHSVHHGSVSRNYTEIFAPSDTSTSDAYAKRDTRRDQVEKWVFNQGGAPLLQSVRKSLYGLTSSNLMRTHLFFIPSSILLTFLSHHAAQAVGLQPGIVFDASVFVISLMWIANSTIYHVYLHMTRKDGLKKANPILRWYLKTRLSNFIARSHRTHHTMGGRVNQNLTPFVDYFSAWSPVSITDLIELRKRKTFY